MSDESKEAAMFVQGMDAASLWYMGLQPDKVLGGRLLEKDDGTPSRLAEVWWDGGL